MIHDFRVRVSTENFENAIGWNIVNKRFFLVAKPDGQIIVFDEHNYEEKYRIDLELPKSDSREQIQILSMDGSSDNEYLALFVGKQLIKDEE